MKNTTIKLICLFLLIGTETFYAQQSTEKLVVLSPEGGSLAVKLPFTVSEHDQITISENWCEVQQQENRIEIKAAPNHRESTRTATVRLKEGESNCLIRINQPALPLEWDVIWEDHFDGNDMDQTKWGRIVEGGSDWKRYMSLHDSCYAMRDGKIVLRGIVNTVDPSDKRPYLTGGITSQGKFAFQYGKIEICAKLGSAKGAWPAFWMLSEQTGEVVSCELESPQAWAAYAASKPGIGTLGWPKSGEIDIMEHLNYDDIIYQTAHSYYTFELKQGALPKQGGVAKFDKNNFNVFGLEWTPNELIWTINGATTFSYPRIETDKEGQWPFNTPFFILIDMQLEGSWVGKTDPSQLPVEMEIDWVKVSQLKPETVNDKQRK